MTARLGARAGQVARIVADIRTADLGENTFDVWHDRAVFHFLTEEADRRAYVERLRRALSVGGHIVLATFALTGPAKCSGLDVVRYDPPSLARELGPDFALTTSLETTHVTPAGKEQRFLYCRLTKLAA